MSWIYLSHVLRVDTPAYGGRASLVNEATSSMAQGAPSHSARWTMSNHLGTHLDAPFHFDARGLKVDEYDAGFWRFDMPRLIDVPKSNDELITQSDIDQMGDLKGCDLLLLRTGFEKHRGQQEYWEHNPGISVEAAHCLRKKFPALRAVGMDMISVSRWQDREGGREAHRAFLSHSDGYDPIILIEDMMLAHVPSDRLGEIWVLPLRVQDSDGSPCTVVGRIS